MPGGPPAARLDPFARTRGELLEAAARPGRAQRRWIDPARERTEIVLRIAQGDPEVDRRPRDDVRERRLRYERPDPAEPPERPPRDAARCDDADRPRPAGGAAATPRARQRGRRSRLEGAAFATASRAAAATASASSSSSMTVASWTMTRPRRRRPAPASPPAPMPAAGVDGAAGLVGEAATRPRIADHERRVPEDGREAVAQRVAIELARAPRRGPSPPRPPTRPSASRARARLPPRRARSYRAMQSSGRRLRAASPRSGRRQQAPDGDAAGARGRRSRGRADTARGPRQRATPATARPGRTRPSARPAGVRLEDAVDVREGGDEATQRPRQRDPSGHASSRCASGPR